MSADHDRTFIRTFLIVLGVLVAFTFTIIIIARILTATTTPDQMPPAELARVKERTQPVFEVVTNPGELKKVAASGGAKPAGKQASKPMTGEQVFKQVCSTCHKAGVAGAPKVGDKSEWSARLKKGRDTLYKHAINGFKAMPPKGGNSSLSDQEVKNDVDYMLEHSGQ